MQENLMGFGLESKMDSSDEFLLFEIWDLTIIKTWI